MKRSDIVKWLEKHHMGKNFYSTIEQQACLGGAGAIGLRDMPLN